MDTYTCIVTASIGVKVKAKDYKEATKKGIAVADDLQHATTGALKYLGIRWELDGVIADEKKA